MVESREGHFFGFSGFGKGVGGFQTAQQGELGEEVGSRFKLSSELLKRDEVFVAGVVVGKLLLHVVLVNGEEDAGDHLGWLHLALGGREFGQSVDELIP